MTQAGGSLLVLAVMLPVIAMLLGLILGGRYVERVALVSTFAGLVLSATIVTLIWTTRTGLEYHIGGWAPPLGVALRADGPAAVMLLLTSVVMGAAALFSRASFRQPCLVTEQRAPLSFWLLFLAIAAALNTVFLGADLFNLYVALELLTFAAVPLVCLGGGRETLEAGLRYLMFALLGSALYLLGATLLYGAYGTLDIGLLAGRVRPEPASWVALALMTAGLMAKTALFPLHLWLPPAHAGAPAGASAVLSALVVKASFFLIVRLWFDALPVLITPFAAQILGALGASAILYGSLLALRQSRLKLLVAYSTVAQIGYLFFVFPLAAANLGQGGWNAIAWSGAWMQLVGHALAKAAMFMAAGLIAERMGHDRIADLRGLGRVLPVTVLAFGLGGLSLMGLPPSGGFVAKLLLLSAATAEGQWLWAVVILLGGILAGGYLFRVLSPALREATTPLELVSRVSMDRQVVALALAVAAVLIGLAPLRTYTMLEIGRPAFARSTVP